ncbi:MAG: hypothetical protein KF777_24450 [Planctomycetaceae bacterium]|nr:hypothetical protein [Planctomycetaceae bacterium]
MNGDWAERPVYWATLAYARWWLTINGILLRKVERDGLTPDLLRTILINYDVNRAVSTANAENFIAHVVGIQAIWPSDLIGRAKACAALAKDAKRLGWTAKEHASAATKVMWFLEPDDWTVFDSYAATGAGVSKALTGVDRMLAFYDKLDQLDFCRRASAMQSIVAQSSFPGMSAARVLDSYLMALGGRGRSAADLQETQDFLDLLPTSARGDLIGLAQALQAQVGNAVLTKDSETVPHGA